MTSLPAKQSRAERAEAQLGGGAVRARAGHRTRFLCLAHTSGGFLAAGCVCRVYVDLRISAHGGLLAASRPHGTML